MVLWQDMACFSAGIVLGLLTLAVSNVWTIGR